MKQYRSVPNVASPGAGLPDNSEMRPGLILASGTTFKARKEGVDGPRLVAQSRQRMLGRQTVKVTLDSQNAVTTKIKDAYDKTTLGSKPSLRASSSRQVSRSNEVPQAPRPAPWAHLARASAITILSLSEMRPSGPPGPRPTRLQDDLKYEGRLSAGAVINQAKDVASLPGSPSTAWSP